MEKDSLLILTEQYVTDILKNKLSADFVFHNFDYTRKVVDAVQVIAVQEQLSTADMELAQIAAWFHATGYRDTHMGHEEKSKSIATEFLSKQNVSDENISKITDSIMATQNGNEPSQNIAKVLVDGIQMAINGDPFKVQEGLRRQELLAVEKVEQSEVEGLQDYLETIVKQEFHTAYGIENLQPARDKLKIKLEKRLNKLQKAVDVNLSSELGVTAAQLKAMKKKLQKAEGRPERGIETMFRLTSKNHLDLSGMADGKANIMISINSIIMSVVMGSLMSKLDSNTHLYYPTVILLLVNLASLIFAILSLRPNVSDGLFTRKDIEDQKTNLLFFGNFHKMKREDYHWGMNKLMENASFLYSNLIDDIYFLGVVLARKYKLLRTSYNVFMYGMIVVVIAYIISLSYAEMPINEVIRNSLQ